MIILSLDTTSRAGSAAVLRDGIVLAERAGDARFTHGQRLPGELMAVLTSADLRIEDVGLFAVTVGPGSFTGLRVGIATIQGLAMARGVQVVPVSTLDALAHAVTTEQPLIASWIDAQRGEVFAAAFDGRARHSVAGPTAASPAQTLAAWADLPGIHAAVFIGDGAVRYEDAIRSVLGSDVAVESPPPLAPVIGRLAAAWPESAVPPHALIPVYVRRPDAEIARARREEQHAPDGPR